MHSCLLFCVPNSAYCLAWARYDACVYYAELIALGNAEFVNTHRPGKTSPMVYAVREGHSAIILPMMQCGGSPEAGQRLG